MAPQRTTGALPPSRLRERRKRVRRVKWIIICASILVFLACLVGLTHLNRVRVTDVAISQTKTVSAAAVEERVREVLSGYYLYVLPKNNVLVYSKKHIVQSILREFPEIKTAEVRLKNFHAIEVTVEERIPVALWCGQSISAGSSHPCFFLDEGGYVYGEAPEYSGDAYVRWYGEISTPNPPAQFLNSQAFRSLSSLLSQLKSEAGEPVEVIADGNDDVRVSFSEGFDLLFTLMQTPEEVIANLKAAKTADVLLGKKLSSLLYLDLRFGNKMYYKFK